MAYRGPSGLLGTPDGSGEDPGDYTPFPLVGHPELTGYLHREVREWMDKTNPTPEAQCDCDGDTTFNVPTAGLVTKNLEY